MTTPTLGFEDHSTLSKRDIARVQLVEAITLFLGGKFLCSITLAGAAESVLAGLLSTLGERSAVEESTDSWKQIASQIGLKVFKFKNDTDYYNDWNQARNAIKHQSKYESERLTINLFAGASIRNSRPFGKTS